MKTGWLFFKLAFAARGPFDSSPVYFNEDGLTCPGTGTLLVIGNYWYEAATPFLRYRYLYRATRYVSFYWAYILDRA